MKARNYFIFWTGTALAFLGFVFLFKEILLPFVVGIALAYFFNPVVVALEKADLKRKHTGLLIALLFVVLFILLITALAPILYREASDLSVDLPVYLQKLALLAQPVTDKIQYFTGQQTSDDLYAMANAHAGTGVMAAGNIFKGLTAGGLWAINMISFLILTPIVSYFMIKEWDTVTRWVIGLMPRDHENTIMSLLRQIDQKLSGFVRGQISVAVVLGLSYALILSLVGLKYGFLIGLGAGLLNVIPMVGSTVGLFTGALVAWFQTGEWSFVLIVAGIFLAGQIIEGNILTPKLVGGRVGLHPLWVFFALMAGGSLFGILGIFLAVPVAAVIGVLGGFAIKQYKASPYYKSKPKSKKTDKA